MPKCFQIIKKSLPNPTKNLRNLSSTNKKTLDSKPGKTTQPSDKIIQTFWEISKANFWLTNKNTRGSIPIKPYPSSSQLYSTWNKKSTDPPIITIKVTPSLNSKMPLHNAKLSSPPKLKTSPSTKAYSSTKNLHAQNKQNASLLKSPNQGKIVL